MRYILLALLSAALATVAAAEPARIIALPLTDNLGAEPKAIHFPNGTDLSNVAFFRSEESDLTVGRTTLDGAVFPTETTDYTDVFLVARGTATLIDGGVRRRLRAGDFLLLPRGTTFEGRDMRHYVHFFASFERRAGRPFSGTPVAQPLQPGALRGSDFVSEGGLMRHVYYEGRGGVIVEAVQYPKQVKDTAFRAAAESELLFVVSGSGSIMPDGGGPLALKPHTAVLIPKGATFKLTAVKLRALSVRFDRPSLTEVEHTRVN